MRRIDITFIAVITGPRVTRSIRVSAETHVDAYAQIRAQLSDGESIWSLEIDRT